MFSSSTVLVGTNMAAASDIGESDPGSGCDVIGVSIPPIVGVSTFWGDAVVGNDSSRLKRRSRLLVSGLFVATGLGAFFGLSSSDDEPEESDSDSELLSSLLSSVSDFSFFFFAASDPGFGAGLAFVSAFLASTETSGSRSDLTDFEGSTFSGPRRHRLTRNSILNRNCCCCHCCNKETL